MTETNTPQPDADAEEIYLKPTAYIDSDHPKLRAHAANVVEDIPEQDGATFTGFRIGNGPINHIVGYFQPVPG